MDGKSFPLKPIHISQIKPHRAQSQCVLTNGSTRNSSGKFSRPDHKYDLAEAQAGRSITGPALEERPRQ